MFKEGVIAMTGAGVSAMLRWSQGKSTDENTELEWSIWLAIWEAGQANIWTSGREWEKGERTAKDAELLFQMALILTIFTDTTGPVTTIYLKRKKKRKNCHAATATYRNTKTAQHLKPAVLTHPRSRPPWGAEYQISCILDIYNS